MDEVHSSYPASWMRPDEVMKMVMMKRRKRKLDARLGFEKKSKETATMKSDFEEEEEEEEEKNGEQTKRRKQTNPFRKDNNNNNTRQNEMMKAPVAVEESSDETLFQLLTSSSMQNEKKQREEETNREGKYEWVLDELKGKSKSKDGENDEEKTMKNPPIDWSLKTRLTITSASGFPWSTRSLKTVEEASATTAFVRCLNSDEKGSRMIDTGVNAELHRLCFVWMYPSLPGVDLFPRMSGRGSKTNKMFHSDEKFAMALRHEWRKSLISLYKLFRAKQCPFFYVCADSFTVLFRAAGVAGCPEMNAMIYPTTKTIRDALTKEDINFVLPLSKNGQRHSSTDSGIGTDSEHSSEGSNNEISNSKLDLEIDEGLVDEDETISWMKSVGLDEKVLASTSSQNRSKWEVLSLSNDSSPETLVSIEEENVHAFFNFLQNSERICISNTGSRAGIPPTLLSPVGFKKASLEDLRVRHRQVQQGKRSLQSLMLEGPILPHVVHSFVHLLKKNADPNDSYSISLSNVDRTAAFSIASMRLSPSPSTATVFSKENLIDCGLNEDLLQLFCSSSTSQHAIRNVICERGRFRCS